jgi:hypothetical protein
MITVTIAKQGSTTITGAPVMGLTMGMLAAPLRAATPATTSSACVADVNIGNSIQTYTFVETYAAVLLALTEDAAESGAEMLTNKATTFGTINDTLYPSVEAVVEVAQPIWYFAATGTDTYAATLTGIVPTAYYAGMQVKLLFGITNTGAATINLNTLGAKAITKGTAGTTALSASDLVVTKVYTLIYDGTRFQINL